MTGTARTPTAGQGRPPGGNGRAAVLAALLLVTGALPAAARPAPLPDAERTTISTVAGMGRYNGDGQLGKDATLTMPFGQGVTGTDGHRFAGLAVDGAGNLYLADRGNNRVRKVSLGPDGTTLTGTISTVAGNGALATAGDGGPAVRASLYNPAGLAVAPDGTVYVAEGAPTTPVAGLPEQPASRLGYPFDRPVAPAEPVAPLYGRRVRKVAPDGTISTVAGTGVPGVSGDGGPAAQARLIDPAGLALLGDGSLLIADAGAGRVRRLAPDGTLRPFAGRGAGGTAAAPGSVAENAPLPATEAVLLRPTGVAVGPDGTVYIAERGGHRVRAVDPSGAIGTVAGNGLRALDTSLVDPLDTLLQAQFGVQAGGLLRVSTRFGEFDPGHTPKLADNCTGAAVAPEPFCPPAQTDAWGARLNAPAGVAVGPDGTVYVADTNDNLVRRVTDQATTQRLYGLTNPKDGDELKALKDAFGRPVGRIATVAGVRAGTLTLPVNTGTGAGDIQGSVALPGFPPGFRVPVGPAPLCPTCTVAVGLGGFRYGDTGSTDGQEAIYTELRAPQAVAVAPGGVLYVLDQGNNRVLRLADGRARRVAGAYNGDGGAARSTQLMNPRGVAFGPDGSMYVADSDRSVVRRVSPDGSTISVVAGTGTRGDGGDGGPATRAPLAWPTGVAVAGDGSVYIADRGAHRVRRVAPDGTISTVAGTGEAGYRAVRGVDPEGAPAATQPLDSPAGVALAADGTLYIADTFNNLVRKVTPEGRMYTVAGTGAAEYNGDRGSGRGVALNQPTSVSVGAGGAVYVADSRNGLIRRLDPSSGALATVAGNADGRDGGEGAAAAPGAGPLAELRARNARLSFPEGVAAGADGTLYVADTGANRLRAVGPDGALVTLAGPRACPTILDDLTCPSGESGDGGPAAQALLRAPRGVAVDAAGRVLVADTENNRVRLLAPAP